MEDSPSIARLFTHIHFCRLVFIQEDAPECARALPEGEWREEQDRNRIAQWLEESAEAVREAVEGRLAAGQHFNKRYDHPLLFLQHMLWHEGYHHGQIKLALKLAGQPLGDEEVGPLTWDLWMLKARASEIE
jgi:uncharacterized damage-inducible protein DinB